jgi:hypothetical protein
MLRIRIRMRVKSRIRIRIEVRIQKLWRLRIEPWRAEDAHNGGTKWSRVGSLDQWSQICLTLMTSRIRIRIKVKDGSRSASK